MGKTKTLLTTVKASEELGISPYKVRRLLESGNMKAFYAAADSRPLIHRSEIERMKRIIEGVDNV